MKYFWLFLVLAAVAGTGGAWLLNNQRYAGRETAFGKIQYGSNVDASNVIELVKQGYIKSGAKAEMLTEEFYDFGSMALNEKGSQTFKVKNVGTEPLSLKVGSSTCKCTIGSLSTNTLAPGEQTDIKIEWTVKTADKSFSQRAQIITNDPNKVVLDLRISGEVLRDLVFQQSGILLGDIAAGEGFGMEAKVYSYLENGIDVNKVSFVSKQLEELAEVEVEEFKASEADGDYSTATQSFKINVKVKPGLRQGLVSTRMLFNFFKNDEQGNRITDEESEEDARFFIATDINGRIVGALSVIESKMCKQLEDGNFLYNFGKLNDDDKRTAKVLIKLKGTESEGTTLRVGKVTPSEAIKATLEKAIGRGDTVLYPLEIEIVPGDEPIDLTGKNGQDYGSIWIESDNPKVPKMLIAVKFAINKKAINAAD